MSQRSVTHATFALERLYPASPARVFNAFADPQAKALWFGGPDEWVKGERTFDFRVGGRETSSGGPVGGQMHAFNCLYQDIVPNERIIYTYDMALDGVRISVSLAIIEIRADGAGTRLVLTEHGAFLDGYDDPAGREHGTGWLLDKLGKSLQADAPAA
ncbi:SRPBCC family protein [Labrys monachus]|uniref:Uncharacterized protein YndB with AHSA1/START domain n=1 Tax=Labrys monachus TaxID=217067 RepID=A0ABU0FEE5_9HYPH|nr:SRPBCC family protein [Labrys monachus]MDQ0392983.1 uncharacterized protein YndB with AHSA1/START domain [Labrys monachus]